MADLGGGEDRLPFGSYAFLLTDLTFSTSIPQLEYNSETGAVDVIQIISEPTPAPDVVTAVCPNLNLACSSLFNCGEAQACLDAGNFSLDQNGDGIPCNEAGNLLLGTSTCLGNP
jgi:hypothetical protein